MGFPEESLLQLWSLDTLERSLHVVSVVFLFNKKLVSSLCVWKVCLKCVHAKNISLFVYSSTIFLNECHDWSVVEGNHDIIHLLDRWWIGGNTWVPGMLFAILYHTSRECLCPTFGKSYRWKDMKGMDICWSTSCFHGSMFAYQKNSVSETPQCWGTFWCIHPLQIQWWLW